MGLIYFYISNLSTSKLLSKVDLSYLFHDSFNIVNESISYSGFNMKHCTTKMNASRFLQNIQIPTSFFHEITKPINIEIIGAYKWILALANHLKCLVVVSYIVITFIHSFIVLFIPIAITETSGLPKM